MATTSPSLRAAANEAVVDPVRPLIGLIWCLPILWTIGGERLLFPILAIAWLLPKIRKSDNRALTMIAPLWWFAGFLLLSLLSITQINTDSRIITFVWDFSIYLGFFSAMLFINKNLTEFAQIERVMFHLVMFSVVTQLVALTYFVFGSWRYNSIIGQLLPASLQDTMIGKGVLMRAVGRELYLLGINERVKSIFSSSIHFGTVLMMTIALTAYFVTVSKGWRKAFYVGVIFSSAVLLLYSQSRTAMLLSVVMVIGIWTLVVLSRSRAFGPQMVAAALGILFVFALMFTIIAWQDISSFIQDVFIESRASSFENRSEIYSQTIQRIFEDPIIGHGTQTDVPGLSYPLGSHNWFLSILFKHGLVAFLPFMVFLTGVLGCAIANVFRTFADRKARIMAIVLGVWLVGYLLLCLTIEPVVDAMHLFHAGCMMGAILTLPNMAQKVPAGARKAGGRLRPLGQPLRYGAGATAIRRVGREG